ncbi:hypothetical protein AYO44_16655 [Planctomycetaceae bacterium SCGC AG-212-F19]|nr:hypothetical protein AYO44_16655 [Planctomycetaceae bacterium SCGC AG-212-F19]
MLSPIKGLRCTPLLLLAAAGLIVASAYSPGQAPTAKAYLLNVAKGQAFNDIGSDDKTRPEAVDDFKELGGKALKVAFFKGDSVGDRVAKVKNWKPFAALRVIVFNPGKDTVKLGLNIIHARSTNVATRIEVPVVLKPGKNELTFPIEEVQNTNGSPPVLTDIRKWYFGDSEGKGPTLYFGDMVLEGSEAAGASPAGGPAAGGLNPLVGYKIVGKVGASDIDLTITPFNIGSLTPTPVTPGRVRGDPARLERIRAARMPKIDKPILFGTPEADAIVSALEIFPPDNPCNLVVEDWPVHPNSKNIIDSIGANKKFRYNADMGYVLIPPDQKRLDVKLGSAAAESDKGPYPVPDNTPIEGYPVHYKGLTLDEVQRKEEPDIDRHALVVDPTNRMLYEFYQMRKTDKGWVASGEATFDMKSNKLRPDGWTSADAAGLSIFATTVRYDEIKRGIVEHAMRVGVNKTRRAYVYPATHYASRDTDENLPRMGERIRLKKDFDIRGFSPEAQAILKGLKKYGMFVADNGLDWTISVVPDPRIPLLHDEFSRIKGSAFEVVEPPPGYQPPK